LSFNSPRRNFERNGESSARDTIDPLGLSREGDMVEKPTNLKFMDQDIIKENPIPKLFGDPYSGTEHIPKRRDSHIFLHKITQRT
jgi:hypothetical protein